MDQLVVGIEHKSWAFLIWEESVSFHGFKEIEEVFKPWQYYVLILIELMWPGAIDIEIKGEFMELN